MIKHLFLILSLVCLVLTTQAQTQYFATDKGNDTNDGLSWETPKTLYGILTSVDLVTGDEIFVKKGTYTAPENTSFVSNKAAVKVYGNCEGTETEKPTYDVNAIETYLVGNGRRVLYFNTASVFSGFDISGGDAYNSAAGASGRGGGVYIDNTGGRIEYCVVRDNVGAGVDNGTIRGVGGGVFSIGVVENCRIENNTATANTVGKGGIGGGIRLDGGGKLINSIVKNNKCLDNENNENTGNFIGGGVSVVAGSVVNCLIEGNSTNSSDNNTNYGGGVDISFTSSSAVAYIINCTVVGNSVTGRGGGIGAKANNDNYAHIINCIFWNNTARTSLAETNNVGVQSINSSVTYSLWAEAEIGTGDNNLNEDPLFVVGGGYSLQDMSPAVDAGNNTAIDGYVKDLAGNNRVLGGAVDLGAYETAGIPTFLEKTEGNDVLTGIEYYTLDGQRMKEAVFSGFYIVKKTFASGKTETTKIFFAK